VDTGVGGQVAFVPEHDEQAMTVFGLSSKRRGPHSIRVRTAVTA
jgi:hypothetical protein